MSPKLKLPSGGKADYAWGSLMPRFNPTFVQVNKRTFMDSAVHLNDNLARWKTSDEFSETIGYLHELVHYLQDVSTGVGCWDHWQRDQTLGMSLTLARDYSGFMGSRPYGEERLQDWEKDFLFVPRDALPEKRRVELIQRFAKTISCDYRPGDEQPACIECLLEGEAVATVFLQMLNIRETERQHEIRRDFASLYHPDEMPDDYVATLEQIQGSLVQLVGPDDVEQMPPAQLQWFIRVIYKVATFLIDLSFAHPSPFLLDRVGHNRYEYEPGIRLFRLLKALWASATNSDESADMSQFLEALDGNDVRRMEDVLLRNCDFPYCESEAVYDDWRELFQQQMQDDDNRLLQLRRYCCEVRLNKPASCVTKSLSSILDTQIPILALTGKDYAAITSHPDLLQTQDRMEWLLDLMANKRDMELREFFFSSGTFVCPFAEAGLCQVATNACRQGITSFSEFPAWDAQKPPNQSCGVRGDLEEAGFDLDS
jgi:hypothetical protein